MMNLEYKDDSVLRFRMGKFVSQQPFMGKFCKVLNATLSAF
jgi:hypothetical protein